PLLSAGRPDLRSFLNSRNISWVEDPSNDDLKYDRIKARKALDALAPLGIDATSLGQVAANLSQARAALKRQSYSAARKMLRVDAGAVVMDHAAYLSLPDETARRLTVQALAWVGGALYPARRAPVAALIDGLKQGRGATVDGCHVSVVRGDIWVFREYDAVKNMATALPALWDARWDLRGPSGSCGSSVRALGDAGLAQCPDWRETGRPHRVLRSTPAVWSGDKIIAAPLARPSSEWQAEVVGGEDAFFATLLSH
ncbi:MAG: tRNA(Ile)-lysidine synthetase, partial [Sulfitobacter sp.]